MSGCPHASRLKFFKFQINKIDKQDNWYYKSVLQGLQCYNVQDIPLKLDNQFVILLVFKKNSQEFFFFVEIIFR